MFNTSSGPKLPLFIKICNHLPVFFVLFPNYNYKSGNLASRNIFKIYGLSMTLFRIALYINYLYGFFNVLSKKYQSYHAVVEMVLFIFLIVLQIKMMVSTYSFGKDSWLSFLGNIKKIDKTIQIHISDKANQFILLNSFGTSFITVCIASSMIYWAPRRSLYISSLMFFVNSSFIILCNATFVAYSFALIVKRRYRAFNEIIRCAFTIKWGHIYNGNITKDVRGRVSVFTSEKFICRGITILDCVVKEYNEIFGIPLLLIIGISQWSLLLAVSYVLSHTAGKDIQPYIIVFGITLYLVVSQFLFALFIKL